MGEATLEQALRTLAGTMIADTPFAVTLHRVAELAAELGPPVTAVEVKLVDPRGRPLEEVHVGAPAAGPGNGSADRFALPLEAGGASLGTLTLYGQEPGGRTEEEARLLQDFAAQAAVVLANARAYWDLHEVASGLQAAMQSRAAIEQAKGMLMAREGCSADEAFTILARASQRENVKLRELARRIVQEDARL